MERQLYYLAARYQEDSVSKGVYTQAQELIRDNECELSAYRYLANTLEKPWHVVVIGGKPQEQPHQLFVNALSSGTMTTIDPKLAVLMERRHQEIQQGDWREHHANISMKKKKQGSKKRHDRRHRGR